MNYGAAILSNQQLAEREHVTKRTVMRWRVTGEGPPYIRIGARRIGYPLAGVEKWEASRTFAHRAEELSQATAAKSAA